MSGAFTLIGGGVDAIRAKLTTTGVTAVAGLAEQAAVVISLRCNEIAGLTPALTVEVYDAKSGLIYYLGTNGVTYKAKALTAGQSVFFEDGIVLRPNEFLRVTASVANQIDVVGIVSLGQALG